MSLKAKTVPATKIPVNTIDAATRFMTSSYAVFSIDLQAVLSLIRSANVGRWKYRRHPALSNLPSAVFTGNSWKLACPQTDAEHPYHPVF
jgi:hypothetical protein